LPFMSSPILRLTKGYQLTEQGAVGSFSYGVYLDSYVEEN